MTLAAFLLIFHCAAADIRPLCLGTSSPWWTRLTYQLCHGGVLHCILNIWCFLGCVFVFDMHFKKVALAVAAAALIPPFLLPEIPLAGFSGAVYALFGMAYPRVTDKFRFLTMLLLGMVPGIFFPLAVGVHAYCFLIGVSLGKVLQWK